MRYGSWVGKHDKFIIYFFFKKWVDREVLWSAMGQEQQFSPAVTDISILENVWLGQQLTALAVAINASRAVLLKGIYNLPREDHLSWVSDINTTRAGGLRSPKKNPAKIARESSDGGGMNSAILSAWSPKRIKPCASPLISRKLIPGTTSMHTLCPM